MKELRIRQAVEGYLIARAADGFSENSILITKWALYRLVDYTENSPLGSIDTDTLRGFMTFMRKEYAPTRSGGDKSPLAGSSIYRLWASVRAFFHWAEIEYGIDRPDLRLPRPRFKSPVIKPLTEDEIKALLSAAEYTVPIQRKGQRAYRQKRPTASRDVALMMVLLDTGIRVSECARLVISDVDLEAGEIIIRPYNSSVKSKPRTVFLGRVSRRAVWRYINSREAFDNDPLFVTQKGKPMDRNVIRQVLGRIGERASVSNVHPHKFRHTFAIQFLRNGGDVFSLQRLLGHSTLEMVKNYLAIADSDAKDVHRAVSPADRWSL